MKHNKNYQSHEQIQPKVVTLIVEYEDGEIAYLQGEDAQKFVDETQSARVLQFVHGFQSQENLQWKKLNGKVIFEKQGILVSS